MTLAASVVKIISVQSNSHPGCNEDFKKNSPKLKLYPEPLSSYGKVGLQFKAIKEPVQLIDAYVNYTSIVKGMLSTFEVHMTVIPTEYPSLIFSAAVIIESKFAPAQLTND